MEPSFYEQVGGEPFFERLVAAFYEGVERDDELRAMYPQNLDESRHNLMNFLIQYWGGPKTYMEERGHPRLRMRHDPFRINHRARDAWLAAMNAALVALKDDLSEAQLSEMSAYFDMAARQLRNV